MKITKVEPIWLRAKGFNEPCEWGEDAFILKIYDDKGNFGVGESDSAPAVLKAMFTQPSTHGSCMGLSEVLIGQDPRNISKIMGDLFEASAYYGRRGAAIHALSAIDIALHDLVGKIYGVSVATLLGGARRDHLNAYATFIPDRNMQNSAKRALELKNEGFKLLKFGGDGFGAKGKFDIDTTRAIRKAIGDDIKLSIDLVGLWKNYGYAKEQYANFAEFNLEWIEEPVPSENMDCYARLSDTLPCKITGGEALATEYEFDEFCKKSRVAIVQPDLTRCGGFLTMKKIENIAISNGCELVPHGFSTQILLHATAQFLASSKTCNLIEYSKSTSPLFNICNPLPCEDGIVKINDCVGLGITLNEEIIKKYEVKI